MAARRIQPVGDPIILTATTLLASGADAQPNVAALTNPYGLPMELREVRITITPVSNGEGIGLTGQSVSMKADLGSMPVIDADVPVGGLGTYRDSVPSMAGSADIDATGDQATTYLWRLKYPLFIGGGKTLNIKFTHKQQVPYPIQVVVTYHCQMFAKKYRPDRLMVPWVCSFGSKAFAVLDSATDVNESDESSELDIINQFGTPIEVTRLVGNYNTVTQNAQDFAVASDAINMDQLLRFTYATMQSSQGDNLVFTPTPFGQLWPNAWRSWDLPDGVLLDPQEWLKIQLQHLKIDYTLYSLYVGAVSFAVTMTSYREVLGSEFAGEET